MKRAGLSASSVASLLTVLAGCAAGRASSVAQAPDALKPPDDTVMTLMTRGAGVQIYECTAAKEDATHFAWSLKAPEAELKNASGTIIARHYAGPTWEALDGSTIVGEVVARDLGPEPSSIPWLLLRVKSSSGQGVFGAIVWVQRLRTNGGIAPSAGCDPTHAGDQSRVPYSAEYDFYATRG